MNKGWVYIVTDGVSDVFKFGFTIDPFSRLSKYNSTESFRPVRFVSLVEYSTEREARDVEIEVRRSLDEWIQNPQLKPEISIDTKESVDTFNRIVDSSNFVSKDKATLYNSIFETSTLRSVNYEKTLNSIVEKALEIGLSESEILKSILDNNVGYFYEDAPKRVIVEKRRKFLITLSGKDVYYDTKPKVIERFARLSTLDFELKTHCLLS